MRFHYGAGDEKYVVDPNMRKRQEVKLGPLDTYKFSVPYIMRGRKKFDRLDVPLVFKATPDTLLELCSKVVNAIPMPPVHTWSTDDVCQWIRQFGYPQYRTTFRVNMVNGRTLILLDAANLSAMNIKRFDHIKHIAYGIRTLFNFELTKFSRSISLPPNYYYELYLLYRVKNGAKYELTRRTDLWRQMQLIRQKPEMLSHWTKLERWLAMEPSLKEIELIGGAPRYRLYYCKPPLSPWPSSQPRSKFKCTCMPPCECIWTEERDLRPPWHLSCLGGEQKIIEIRLECSLCHPPPCTCTWNSKNYLTNHILECLQIHIPLKYGPLRRHSEESICPWYNTRFSYKS